MTKQDELGSPPQVRGKLTSRTFISDKVRITPAGAGKTFSPPPMFPNKQDHPRRCGENAYLHLLYDTIHGSPPQVRGKPQCKNVRSMARRITPAGAGKTNAGGLNTALNQDHPRRCGENTKKIL